MSSDTPPPPPEDAPQDNPPPEFSWNNTSQGGIDNSGLITVGARDVVGRDKITNISANKEKRPFGRYQLIRKLGKGGFADVFLAYDPDRKDEVALKILREDLMANSSLKTRFHEEADLARKIKGKNIIGIYDVGEENGRSYISMDYIEGGDLAKNLDKGWKPSLERVIQIIRQVARTLNIAHKQKIIHYDIKPSNIFISEHDAYLGDFGIAHVFDTDISTEAFATTGTEADAYISPELRSLRGNQPGPKVDHRTDIYSLGAILFELLTKHLPLEHIPYGFTAYPQ